MIITVLGLIIIIGGAILIGILVGNKTGSFSSAFFCGWMSMLLTAGLLSGASFAFEYLNKEAITEATVVTITEERIASAQAMYSEKSDSASKLMLVWTDEDGTIHEDELKNHRNGYVNNENWKCVTTEYKVTGFWGWFVSCPEWSEKEFHIPASEVLAGSKQVQ